MSILTGRENHFRVMGRPVIPLLMSLAVLTFAFFWYQIVDEDTILADRFIADTTGFVAGASSAFLFFSWWWRSQRLLLVGLALATGVMLSRALLLVFVADPLVGNFVIASALAWALAAGLTFAAEMRSDYIESARKPFRLRGRNG